MNLRSLASSHFSSIFPSFSTTRMELGVVYLVSVAVAVPVFWILYNHFSSKGEENLEKSRCEHFISKIFKIPVLKIKYAVFSLSGILDEVQKSTETSITISKSTEKIIDCPINIEKTGQLIISGLEKNVERAEEMLAHKIQDITVFSRPLHHTYPRHIIGKHGSHIKHIMRMTGALVIINSKPASKYLSACDEKENEHVLFIVGTNFQVSRAKIEIDNVMFNKQLDRSNNQLLNTQTKPNPNLNPSPVFDQPRITISQIIKSFEKWKSLARLHPLVDMTALIEKDGFVYVWVSSINDPNLFWVQPYLLDTLGNHFDGMNDLSDSNNSRGFRISVGMMVAAPFKDSNSYLRAIVLNCLSNNRSHVFFVDYGDDIEIDNLLLKFMSDDCGNKPWQAVPCSLDSLQPIQGRQWSDKAISLFSRVTNVGVALPSKIKIVNTIQCGVTHVELITCYNNTELNVSEYLIENNAADRKLPKKEFSTPITLSEFEVSNLPKKNYTKTRNRPRHRKMKL